MPNFAVPQFSSDTVGTDSEESERSFDTAEGMANPSLHMAHTDEVLDDVESGHHASNQNGPEISHIISLVSRMEERDRQREAQIATLQNCMTSMMSIMQEQSAAKEQAPAPTTFNQTFPKASNLQAPLGDNIVESKSRMEPFKWPEPYNHTDPSKWNSTYGLLKYIHQRDVVEHRFLEPSDFLCSFLAMQ